MRVEVLDGVERRRRWSREDKARIIEETLAPGAKVSEIARRHGISASLVFTWRRQSRANHVPQRWRRVLPPYESPRTPETAVSTTSEQPRAAGGRNGLIEISLGGGRRVRVDASVDAAALARVLDVLERR